MKNKIAIIGVALLLGACASTSSRVLDNKLSDSSSVKDGAGLQAEAKELVEKSQDLTAEQKAQITELRISVSNKMEAMNRQALTLRYVLMKDMLSPDYNAQEVVLIKNRMRELEDSKLSVIFDSIEKANRILGRQAAENPRLMREFLELHEDNITD